ncbi:MAG: alkaline phosphatase D family protein, partial [Actinobacteria bacterium]|nr:alkaline phosphatase D family protein [Actinomycetota bacterium]
MAPELILGPLLRHVGSSDATVWVETDAPCEVEVIVGGSPHRSRTFSVEGHHYALVVITDLEPGSSYEYSVKLDGEELWPRPGYEFPAPVIRTIAPDDELTLVFGSCRVSLPHEPPYTNKRGKFARGVGGGFERDVLYALALRMQDQSREEWPDALLLLGDQIYADEVSLGTLEFIRSRRETSKPPGEEVADFEEYTRLYWDSWKDPAIRWLLSTVPSAMIFDDHEVSDDWNISESWLEETRTHPWWNDQIVGAHASYWVYQHLGNLSPEDLAANELFQRVRDSDDAWPLLRESAYRAHRTSGGTRWSYHRDFGRVR